jgi:hypothetical protein
MLTIDDINNKHWMKQYLRNVNMAIGDGSSYKEKELTCWSMYYSKMKDTDYAYLTKYGDYDIPVKVRFVSIVRPNVDYLVSKYLSNPFNFSIKTVDKKSLNEKYSMKIKMMVDEMINGIDEKYLALQTQIQMITDKRQELMMILEQEPESEEHAQQLEEIKKQMPLIQMKMQQMTNALQRELKHTNEQMSNADMLSRFKPKDIREDLVQKKMVNFYESAALAETHKWTMTEKCVTGRPYIYVDIVDGELIYEWKESHTVFHSKNSKVRYTEDGDWVAYEEYLSYDQILNQWGKELTAEEIKKLGSFNPNLENSNRIEVYDSDDESEGAANYVQNYKPTTSKSNIRTVKVFWQVSVEIPIIHSKTKDGNFTHKKVVKKKELDEFKKRKNIDHERVSLKKKYKTYAFEGTIINRDIMVGVRKRDHQILKSGHTGWNQLPIIGDGYDDVTRSPYSLIWATKDLQALYQIIEYYEELLLVISGVKGFLMDKSQLPSGMNESEWSYYRKLGTIFIESFKKDRRQQSNFNQFQTYDDSLPASIQYLGNMKDRISQRVDNITGVTRQARGEMQERDAVGNSKLSVQATNILADVLFWEHDQIVRRALSRALNLYCKFIGKDGETFSIFDKALGEYDTIDIPKGLLDGRDYDVFVMNNNKDLRDIEEMRQLIGAEYQRGNIDMKGMIKIFQSTSITEMRILAEKMSEEAMELKQQLISNEAEAQKEVAQFENELAMRLKEGELQLKNLDNQLKQYELDLKDKDNEIKNQLKEREMQSNNFLKALDIVTKDSLERDKLDAEIRSTHVDQLIKQAEIMVQAALGHEKNIVDDRKLSKTVKKNL